jgi:predicted RNA binding protein YcfA (HicA-like mRNA interferase family)
MPRKQSDVERSLLVKGFQKSNGDHHYFHYYSKAGKKTRVFTKTSHGSREIDDGLLRFMAKQVKLTKADFDDLIDCPLDRDSYEKKLIEQAVIEAP